MKAKCISIILVLALAVTSIGAAYAESIIPFASTRFSAKNASLSTSLVLKATAATYKDCNELGVKAYVLYEDNGTRVKSALPKSYTKGSQCSFEINLSEYGESGKSYYAVVTFNADGEMKSKTTGTVEYKSK